MTRTPFDTFSKQFLIAINQLPQTVETLWLRILGRGMTQQQAITELLALPVDAPHRESVLELLMSWKISLEVTGQFQREEQNLMVELSQAYLEWKQQTQQQGAIQGSRSLVLRLLTRRVGELPESVRSQIDTLSLTQLEALGEALLDFENLSDLEAWLGISR